jgi:lysozyme
MNISAAGIKLIESFEGVRLTAYQDIKGIWTIGVGHTGTDVRPGMTITQAQAEQLLLADVAHAVATVNSCVTVTLNQDEFDALVDFAFNAGCGALEGSTLLKDLNGGNYTAAADQFEDWDHAAGKVVAGLLRRREAEAEMFEDKTEAGATRV